MSKLLSRTLAKINFIKLIILAGVILLLISAFSWWRMIYNNPLHVFDRMLATSLSSGSVTKITSQSDDTQKLNQTTTLMTTPKQQVHAIGVLRQVADSETSITTESIGTPLTDYVRYVDIKTSEKSADGKAFNFSEVLGVWGKTDQDNPESGSAQLYNQTLLGVIPIANIPQPLRKELLMQIKNSGVYTIDTTTIKKQIVNGRPVYSYDVSVQPVPYVTMLKGFARVLGLKQLEQVDPNQYAESAPLKFTLDVDVWSGQLTHILYKDSQRTEVLSSYGARIPVALPDSSIPVNELQSRLQQLR